MITEIKELDGTRIVGDPKRLRITINGPNMDAQGRAELRAQVNAWISGESKVLYLPSEFEVRLYVFDDAVDLANPDVVVNDVSAGET